MGSVLNKLIYGKYNKDDISCDYCYQCITDKESLFRVYSRGKHHNYMLCYKCLTYKKRRHNMSAIKTGDCSGYEGVGWSWDGNQPR